MWLKCSLGPPSVNLSCVNISGDVSGAVNVTVSWTLSGRDSADLYLNITSNPPGTPYGGLVNITNAKVTQYELTGFMAGYEYNITVHGMTTNCGGLVGKESEPLTVTPQGKYIVGQYTSEMIHQLGASLSEQQTADLQFCHGTHGRICHCLLLHERNKPNLMMH